MPHTVLFVDDDINLTEGFVRTLRKQPYRILTADSGEEGLKILAKEHVDVVVSDEQMPGMSGTVFLAEAARRHHSVIRVILSGNASVGMALRAVNEGMIFRLLLKPVTIDDLAATIRRCLIHKVLMDHARESLQVMRRQRLLLEAIHARHPDLLGTIEADAKAIVVTELDFASEESLDSHLAAEIRLSSD